MGGSALWRKAGFFLGFTFLAGATALLLAFSVQFFASPSVRAQFSAWAGGVLPAEQQPAPVIQSAPPVNPPVVRQPARSLPVAEPPARPPRTSPIQRPDPAAAEPRQAPIYRVVEEPPPEGSLVIPALKLDQPLVTVPIKEGVWDLEHLGTDVGWLATTGTRPGDDYSMVFIGHITLPYPGGIGPFYHLSALKTGDEVEFHTADNTYRYEVTGRSVVSPDAVDTLYERDGTRLLLVTCTSYDPLGRKYNRRLIIEATLKQIIRKG